MSLARCLILTVDLPSWALSLECGLKPEILHDVNFPREPAAPSFPTFPAPCRERIKLSPLPLLGGRSDAPSHGLSAGSFPHQSQLSIARARERAAKEDGKVLSSANERTNGGLSGITKAEPVFGGGNANRMLVVKDAGFTQPRECYECGKARR